MPSLHSDICIVGAGPAGATTALFLAKAGIPHLLLDAAVFPRDKICGDGLDLKVFRVLRQLDPNITDTELIDHPDFLSAWGARLITPAGQTCDYLYQPRPGEPPYPLFRVAKRLHFDNFLVKKLDTRYTDFRPGTRVEHISRDGKGWRLQARSGGQEWEIRCRLLIGADGDHSVVLRHLGQRHIDPRHYAGILRQYWSGVTGLHPLNLIEVYFPPGLPFSYFYIFPLPNGEANVGFGMVSESIAQGKHHLRNIMDRLLRDDPVLAPRFRAAQALEAPQGWGLPLASRRRQPSGDGYLLVGDAASLICPTSGEGIGTGMMSGFAAAQAAQRAIQAGRFDAGVFGDYNREIYRRLGGEIRQYNCLRQCLPWWLCECGLNALLPTRLLKNWFTRQAGGWLRTAYEKPM